MTFKGGEAEKGPHKKGLGKSGVTGIVLSILTIPLIALAAYLLLWRRRSRKQVCLLNFAHLSLPLKSLSPHAFGAPLATAVTVSYSRLS
jgi:hypothetical protein